MQNATSELLNVYPQLEMKVHVDDLKQEAVTKTGLVLSLKGGGKGGKRCVALLRGQIITAKM